MLSGWRPSLLRVFIAHGWTLLVVHALLRNPRTILVTTVAPWILMRWEGKRVNVFFQWGCKELFGQADCVSPFFPLTGGHMPHGVISSFEGTMTFFAAVSHTHKRRKRVDFRWGFKLLYHTDQPGLNRVGWRPSLLGSSCY